MTTPLTEERSGPFDPAFRTSTTGALPNPVRIHRIGSDRLEVTIRPVDGGRELLALVDRLEQLLGAGYDAIDVVFEPTLDSWPSSRDEHLAEWAGSRREPRQQG